MATHDTSEIRLARWQARLSRLWRWEFWPAWLFYLPLIPYVAWLAIRYRGLATPTAANPAIPHGGFVGESKHEILRRLPPRWIVTSFRWPAGSPSERLPLLREAAAGVGLAPPLVVKPDVGERGAGVRFLASWEQTERILSELPGPVLVQSYHPGPFEAGVFYCRIPHEPRGRIFSITDKHFPQVLGDGRSSVRELIWRNTRYRMQADRFLTRLNGQAEEVLPAGRELRLAMAGNHCQGTLFRDGSHLITPALEERFDEIARQFEGFFFGRFDVRYRDVERFKAGEDFAIVELNGAMSESTNIYDPSWPIWRAYATLMRQWRLLFRIGAANRGRGHPVSTCLELLGALRRHYRERTVPALAD